MRRAPVLRRGRAGGTSCPDERGAAAVEFALVVPIFLALVFGIMYFGFAFAQNLSLGNAARQGARAGVVNDGTTCGGVITMVQNASPTIGLTTGSSVTVTVSKRDATTGSLSPICSTAAPVGTPGAKPCSGTNDGDAIYVKARYTNTLPFPGVTPTVTTGGEGEFRCEWK